LSGDISYALRLLAGGQALADIWKEAGYPSRKALADEIFALAEHAPARSKKGQTRGAGPIGRIIAYSDGASIGNPGHAGCGVLLVDEAGEVVLEDHKYLGQATNNVAEYEGAILALTRALDLGVRAIELRVDSTLLANQIKGGYKVKSPNLATLYRNLKQLTTQFESFDIKAIGRADNKEADRLANLAVASRK